MRMSVVALLLSSQGCLAGAPVVQEFDGAAALRYVEEQMEFGPRIPGTPAHRRAGDWIVAKLENTADTVVVQSFVHVTTDGDSLSLRNFIGRFNRESPRRILFLAHWDTRPVADQSANVADQQRPVPGANDGASGVAVLLGVADALLAQPPALGVDLLFVAGEDYGDFAAGKDVLIGSRHYAENKLPGPLPEYAVLFDMVGDRELAIYKEGNSMIAAPNVVEQVWDVAGRIGLRRYFHDQVRHTVTDDHVSLHAAGIKAIDVIDFDYPHWHTVDDTLDKVSAESLQAVGDLAIALLR